MSFGLSDSYWVEPDPEPPVTCQECDQWERCPCGCEYGWCRENLCYTCEDDEC